MLFRKAGPERLEVVAKTAGNRKRLAAAFDTTEDKLYDEYFKRLANPQPYVEVPSDEAPVHEIVLTGKDVDLTKLPFYPHHAYDGSAISAPPSTTRSIRRTGDATSAAAASACATARDRHQRHRAVRPEAHLHRLRRARRAACR